MLSITSPTPVLSNFCDELSDLLEENIVSDHGVLLLTGNFNIHMDNLQNLDTIIFSDFLELFGLINLCWFSNSPILPHAGSFYHTSTQCY